MPDFRPKELYMQCLENTIENCMKIMGCLVMEDIVRRIRMNCREISKGSCRQLWDSRIRQRLPQILTYIHDISCTIADIKSVADREELYRQIKLFLASETVEDVLDRLFTKGDSTNSKVGVDSLRDLFREGTTAWSKSLEQTEKYEKGEMDDPEKTSPKRKKQSDKADSQFAGGNRRFDGEDGQFAEANKRSVRKAGSSGNVMDGGWRYGNAGSCKW